MIKFVIPIWLLIVLCFFGCNPKPEFYIDGKPYYTNIRCIESKTETKWCYHHGYDSFKGKWRWHYGPKTETECLKSIIDTIEIKQY